MNLTDLKSYFESSPAVGLLRSRNAPFVLDFFDREFKRSGRISIAHSELRIALRAYLEELAESDPDALTQDADAYLTRWCAPDTRWLARRLEGGLEEHVYQLTPHTEEVFSFLDRVLGAGMGFVGTESRLQLVIDTLSDLVISSSDDPEARLAHLREQRRRIDEEIQQIENGEVVARYRPAQIRERFMTAVSLLKQLQGDFRAVEESFRRITADVQKREVEGSQTRGGILEYALDAEDLLKQEDQGVSFDAFVSLILSPAQTERLEEIVEGVRQIPELADQPEGLETVRAMITTLQNEALKVMRTNQRLSTTLRRLLDARASAERQRVAQLLQQIRGLAATAAANPPAKVGLDVEAHLDIESPFRRTFWSEPTHFETVDLTEHEIDAATREAMFARFAAMHRLDWRAMRSRIRSMLQSQMAATLGNLLREHPPKAGVVEALGYLQIARDDGHLVRTDASEKVMIPPVDVGEPFVELTIPLVTFTTRRGSTHVG